MGKSTITMQVENLDGLLRQVQQIRDGGEKAIRNTVNDLKSRAPGWVAQEITKVYNIKKSEITPENKNTNGKRLAGKIRVSGETIENFSIWYTGRLLTPVHFGMTPKAPPKGKNYTLRMTVFKGKREVIGRYKHTRKPGGPYSEKSHNILMRTGNTKAGGVDWIPFQRMGDDRSMLKKFTTLSVPQMVTNETVSKAITARINEEAGKRLTYHADRILSK